MSALWAGTRIAVLASEAVMPAQVVQEFPLAVVEDASPGGIAAGPDGNLWFTEIGVSRIGRITPAGVVTEFPLAAGREPQGITKGPDGKMWFTEFAADRIGRLDPLAGDPAAIEASLVEFAVPGAGSGPDGIVDGGDGALWFTEFGSDEIGRITTAGVVTNEFGVAGSAPL